ncbi:MAG: hypothetical protein KC502_17680 [Myxococcales bacterium]|nr:hypothetical protein [Myxococcales bacterium]
MNTRKIAAILVIAGLCAAASPAFAAELVWSWKKGSTHRYRAQSKQTMRMNAGGMKINAKANIDATYAIVVGNVSPDGTAHAQLVIEKFTVKDGRGRLIAGLSSLPPKALSNAVDIDRKGRFVFKDIFYLMVYDSGESLLVSGKVGPNGGSASASAGGQKVTVWAKFNPKTGKLSSGYSVKTMARKKRTVSIRTGGRRVDVVPKQFMEMLRLPDGAVNQGDEVKARIADWQFNTKITKVTKKTASYAVTIRTPGDGTGMNKPGAKVKVKTRGGTATMGGGMMGGMPKGMAGMMGGIPKGAMGGGMPKGAMMGGAPKGAGARAGAPSGMPALKMTGDFTARHNLRKGVMTGIQGRISTSQHTGGMGMMGGSTIDTVTDLVLSRLK